MKSKLVTDRKGTIFQIVLIISVSLFMGNLNAIFCTTFHPEISYFDREHIIVGGTTAFLTAILFGGLLIYVRLLGNTLQKHKRTEEALHESEQRYRNLVENARDIIFTLAIDGKITALNPVFETITGWSCADWLGNPFNQIIYPDDLPLALEYFQRALKEEHLPVFELRIRSQSGGYLIFEFSISSQIRDGELIAIMGIARDITERKEIEEERKKKVKELEEFYEMAVGRELKLRELKEEVEELKRKLSKDEKP